MWRADRPSCNLKRDGDGPLIRKAGDVDFGPVDEIGVCRDDDDTAIGTPDARPAVSVAMQAAVRGDSTGGGVDCSSFVKGGQITYSLRFGPRAEIYGVSEDFTGWGQAVIACPSAAGTEFGRAHIEPGRAIGGQAQGLRAGRVVALPEQLADHLIGDALDHDQGWGQQRGHDRAPSASMNRDHPGRRDRKRGNIKPREYVLQIAAPAGAEGYHDRRIDHHEGGECTDGGRELLIGTAHLYAEESAGGADLGDRGPPGGIVPGHVGHQVDSNRAHVARVPMNGALHRVSGTCATLSGVSLRPQSVAALPDPVGDMSSILLLIISLVAPWVVQLAPPRQRPVALVAVIAVLLLFGIFSINPITAWQFWVGLIIGIVSIVVWLNMGNRPRGRSRWEDEERAEPTGEL